MEEPQMTDKIEFKNLSPALKAFFIIGWIIMGIYVFVVTVALTASVLVS
jgi:hypothetical protein